MGFLYTLQKWTGILLLQVISLGHVAAASESFAPSDLNGMVIAFQIEKVSGVASELELVAKSGVIIQKYQKTNEIEYRGVGGANHQAGRGTFEYYLKSPVQAELKIYQDDKSHNINYLQFTSARSGTWKRTTSTLDVEWEGHFFVADPNAGSLVPQIRGGHTLSLTVLNTETNIPQGRYPGLGTVILQSYKKDGTYTAMGFGPGTVKHFGTWRRSVLSDFIELEETIQTIPAIDLKAPYIMILVYQTPYSGVWYQDFGSGMIRFSGTFSIFEGRI